MAQNLSLINKKVREYFEVDKYSTKQIFDSLTLYVYSLQTDQNDLYLLAKLLPEDSISQLVSYYDGDYLRIPSKEDYREARLLALSFFLKEMQGWNWQNIRDFLHLPDKDSELLSSISLGRKINNIKDKMNKDIVGMLDNLEDSNLESLIQEYINNDE